MANTFYTAPTANYVSKTLNGAISDVQTTITLNNATSLQAPGYVVIDRTNAAGTATEGSREVVSYTGIAGSDLTGCTRGADGSTGRAHSDGAIVETMPTVGMWNSLTTIVATAMTSDGYLKAINSPVSIAQLETPFVRASSALMSIVTITGHLNVSGASVVGIVSSPTDGWTDASAYTWVYASASTFTIAGVDLTTTFTKGTRLKFTNTTVKYAVVVASTFSTNTTVTIAVNTDYTIANAAISANYYSYAANPQGYPTWFNYTSVTTGGTGITGNAGQFKIEGRACTVNIETIDGTSDATTKTVTIPVPTSSTNKNLYNSGWCRIKNNGVMGVAGQIQLGTSDSIADIYTAWYQTAWTASGAFSIWISNLTYEI